MFSAWMRVEILVARGVSSLPFWYTRRKSWFCCLASNAYTIVFSSPVSFAARSPERDRSQYQQIEHVMNLVEVFVRGGVIF